MNKPALLLLTALLMPVHAYALDLPFFGGDKKDDAGQEEKKKIKTTFLIHFKSGGSLPTDNYTVTEDNVIVMMSSGAIYLDKKMVSSIEEVTGPEEETVQTIQVQQGEEAQKKTSRPVKEESPSEEQPHELYTDPTDDEGHTEGWWQAKIKLWKQKKSDAEEKYAQAENDWNMYNGQIQALEPATPEFERNRLQDMRGTARVSMDRAQAEIDEANKMLDETLPEEARKAGAPPGWVR